MPDITMCSGQDCPFKKTCKRYTSEPSERQYYFGQPPYKDEECLYYWDNYGNVKDITTKDAEFYENQFKPKK